MRWIAAVFGGVVLIDAGVAAAIDPAPDCAQIAKKLAWERSYVRDLQPGPPADQDGSVRGNEPERAEQQDDALKERHQMRRIGKLQALARQKGCPD